jgi:hypothetical protein
MFNSQAKKIVNAALQKAIAQGVQQRKERASKQLLLYQNEQEIYIQANLARTHASPENLVPVGVNVVRKIIRNLAMVYCMDAKRRVEGTEADQSIFTEIETSASLATVMKQGNRLSKLLGTILLRPIWQKEKMELDILTPDILDVTWGDTPAELLEVVITRNDPDGQPAGVTFSRWTADIFQRLDYRGQVLEEFENPYARLPFIPVWAEPPLENFWLPGATDLVMIQDAINSILTDLLHTMRFQSYALLYTKGANIDARKGLTVGPGQVIHLPENGEVGFESPNAPIEQALAAVENLMKQAAISNGLSASTVSLKPSEESGRAKLVDHGELEEMRADDLALFARYEDQLFDLFRTIWNAHNPTRTISPEAVLWCEFYRPEPSQTPYEKTANWKALLELGVMSKVDICMALNPDLDREQAIVQLTQTQTEIEQFSNDPPYINFDDERLPNLGNVFPNRDRRPPALNGENENDDRTEA